VSRIKRIAARPGIIHGRVPEERASPVAGDGPVIEYGSIDSNSSNRFERLKRLERFEPRPPARSPLDRHTSVVFPRK
jgi:hypothetical protein